MRLRFPFLFPLIFGLLAHAQQVPTVQQQKLLDLTNQARSENGLQSLQWDPSLAAAAQAHAQKMFDQHALSHQLPGEPDLPTRAGQAGAHFRSIAENVAMGNGAEGVQEEWMKSPPHRANILDPRLDHVGIGIVEHAGYWYAAVVFDNQVVNAGPDQVEQKIAALLRQHSIDPSRSPDAARKDCAVDSGDVSGSRPLFVMRWDASDLTRLPDPLEQRMSSGRYKTASVGACSNPQDNNQGFTTYHIAVLLY